jgi:hypothetical protein
MCLKIYVNTCLFLCLTINTDAQNVGIGTAAPANRLHIVGSVNNQAIHYVQQNSAGAGSHAIKGEGVYGPTRGYLGIQGGNAFDGTTRNISGQEIGVLGISEGGSTTDNRGVMGLSNGIGVYGQSTLNHGVYGQTDAPTYFPVRSFHTHANGTGILGTANNVAGTYLTNGSGGAFCGIKTGAFGKATGTANGTGVLGVSNGAPNSMLTVGSGISGSSDLFGVTGWSSSSAAVTRSGGYFSTNSGQSYAFVGMRTSTGINRKIEGNGTVNTTVKSTDGKLVLLSCPEAPENLFQDYGSGQLVNGKAQIQLDPNLTKNIAVSEAHPLRVFIQLEGDCKGVYVTNKSADGFDVVELEKGQSNVTFSWSVTANRADEINEDGSISRYSEERFAPAAGPLESKSLPSTTLIHPNKLAKIELKEKHQATKTSAKEGLNSMHD